jgi:SAM-dependent methyltransferase
VTLGYVHGHDDAERRRLLDQAGSLGAIVHHDTVFEPGTTVLEIGCGTGAHTVAFARQHPRTRFIATDIAAVAVDESRRRALEAGCTNVEVSRADVYELPLSPDSVDAVVVSFVLEHLRDPHGALGAVLRVLRPGGTILVVEGDHASAYFHPDSPAARQAIACQVELQRRLGGNADIGRQVGPLLREAGFTQVTVSPRMVYADDDRPDLMDGFTRRTFTAMIAGVREDALAAGLCDAATFDQGLADLERSARPGGVFCYTFFKATGVKDPSGPKDPLSARGHEGS